MGDGYHSVARLFYQDIFKSRIKGSFGKRTEMFVALQYREDDSMNKTCIKLFSFPPEAYHQMEHYFNEMLQKGWRLRWCKGILAGFEANEDKNLRYIVDPYAASSILNLRKFPKYRLNEYMENGWYAAGKSKGCYIFCSDNSNPEVPDLEEDMEKSVIKTSYLGSLILLILLTLVLIKVLTTPAVLYSILLTDVYIILTGLILFLIFYHIGNVFLQLKPKEYSLDHKFFMRYIIHDTMLFMFLISAIFLQVRHDSSMLRYLLLPILVVIIGSVTLIVVSKGTKNAQESNKRLIPVICVIGLILFILIPFSVHRLQENVSENEKKQTETLLTQSYLLPVAHLNDFLSVPHVKNAMKENNSILGNNILYAEEFDDLAVFTNRTEMKTSALAKPIFNYLFIQIQKEQQGAFEENHFNDITYYSLKNPNTILYQDENIVYLCTTPSGISKERVLEVLTSY